jgi:hypothetical protein
MDAGGDEGPEPSVRVVRLCERARLCGEPYVFVAGRWALGETDEERRASLRLLSRWRLYLVIADEDVTRTPEGQELKHRRLRPWEDGDDPPE